MSKSLLRERPWLHGTKFDEKSIHIAVTGVFVDAKFTVLNVPPSAEVGSTVHITGYYQNTGTKTGITWFRVVLDVNGITKVTGTTGLFPDGIADFGVSFIMPDHDVSGSIWIEEV